MQRPVRHLLCPGLRAHQGAIGMLPACPGHATYLDVTIVRETYLDLFSALYPFAGEKDAVVLAQWEKFVGCCRCLHSISLSLCHPKQSRSRQGHDFDCGKQVFKGK